MGAKDKKLTVAEIREKELGAKIEPKLRRSMKITMTKLRNADDKDEETDLHGTKKPALPSIDIKALRDKVEGYFKACDANERPVLDRAGKDMKIMESEPYTIAGLTLAMGFKSKVEMKKYKDEPEFSELMTWAMLKMEHQRNIQLLTSRANPAGVIFDLKNSFGWADTQDNKRIGIELTLQDALSEISGKSRGLPTERMEEKDITNDVEIVGESEKKELKPPEKGK